MKIKVADILKTAERNFSSSDPEQFERYLAAVVMLDGEGSITLSPDKDPPVRIAIIHDGSGYSPGAAICVSDWEGEDAVLEAAHEILTEHEMKDTAHVKELQEEWGEEWHEILTESFDGMVFTLPASEAARIIEKDRFAKEYITIDRELPEEDNAPLV
jgi:hypothetical protein